ASVPRFQVTCALAPGSPDGLVSEGGSPRDSFRTKLRPGGRMSVITTSVSGVVPVLATSTRKATGSKRSTWGEQLFRTLTQRSAGRAGGGGGGRGGGRGGGERGRGAPRGGRGGEPPEPPAGRRGS